MKAMTFAVIFLQYVKSTPRGGKLNWEYCVIHHKFISIINAYIFFVVLASIIEPPSLS